MTEISGFTGQYQFLSNFYRHRFLDDHDVPWPTSEHYFQAHKSVPYSEAVRLTVSPAAAKRLGRQLTLRTDWNQVRTQVMHHALRFKFVLGGSLATALLATGDAVLTESNHWCDQDWGSCTCPIHRDVPGRNLLGHLLMIRRQELRDMAADPDVHEDTLELRRHHRDFARIQDVLTEAEAGQLTLHDTISAIRNIVG